MERLEELEQKLYGPEGNGALARRVRKPVVLPGGQGDEVKPAWEDVRPPKPANSLFYTRMVKIFIGAAAVIAFLGAAFFLFMYLGTRGQEVEITIPGRETAEAGEVFTIPVSFRNISSVAVKEVELTLVLPSGTVIREQGQETTAPARLTRAFDDLAPGEVRQFEIAARLFGEEGSIQKIEAVLLYRPENLRARFSSKTVHEVRISGVPLSLSWDAPETIARGQETALTLRYTSRGRIPFENLSVRLEYPLGFTWKSAEPKPVIGDTIWEIGTLDPDETGVIAVRGMLVGEEGDLKPFVAQIGTFDRVSKEWRTYQAATVETRIAVTPLLVEGLLGAAREGIVNPGTELSFTLRYRNNTPYAVKNVTIRAFVEEMSGGQAVGGRTPLILDFATLHTSGGGVFDGATRAVIWGPGNVRELRELDPAEGGEVGFTINTRSRPAMRAAADREVSVRLRMEIDAAGAPKELAGTNLRSAVAKEFKVRSVLLFAARSLFRSGPLLGAGALPPKVGEKSVYTILWEARNFTNDLSAAVARASLPANVRWENVTYPAGSRINFNEASGEVRWDIGDMRAGTGVTDAALVAAFQVSVVPTEADLGRTIVLARDLRLSGRDVFTGDDLTKEIKELSTELREDSAAGFQDWTVIQ